MNGAKHHLCHNCAQTCLHMLQVSRKLSGVNVLVSHGTGLQGCTALLHLTMADCNLDVLPALTFYSQLTHLCVAGNHLPVIPGTSCDSQPHQIVLHNHMRVI